MSTDLSAGISWFDSHAHLQDDEFADDRQEVLDRAAANQVMRILLPATDLADSHKAIELASPDSRLFCAVGCHPHEAARFTQNDLFQMRSLASLYRGRPVAAIGETGLDYHYDFSPRPVQQNVFRMQLELAFEVGLPVIIHEREAVADCLEILRGQIVAGRLRDLPGVFHCYSGSPETAVILLKMGFYLGVDGPLTFSNARKLPDVVKMCPRDRLVLETDSPYLAPVPRRGRRNEPSFLPLIAAKVAEIWQVPLAEVARLTTANANRLYGLTS